MQASLAPDGSSLRQQLYVQASCAKKMLYADGVPVYRKQLNVHVDDIIDAISKLDPLPTSVLPLYFKRTTKRHVFPTVIMNAVRFLSGTFQWKLHSTSTSIDVIFNKSSTNTGITTNSSTFQCKREKMFFAIENTATCSFCDGLSPFLSTTTCICLAQASCDNWSTFEHCISRGNNDSRSSKLIMKNSKRRTSGDRLDTNMVLRDITNLPARTLSHILARPADSEINEITRVNNMLSNFVVFYFYRLLANNFPGILYQDFSLRPS